MTTATARDLTRLEAQKELGVIKLTMLRMIRRGEFPNAYQVGERGDWRIPRRDLAAYRRRQRVTT